MRSCTAILTNSKVNNSFALLTEPDCNESSFQLKYLVIDYNLIHLKQIVPEISPYENQFFSNTVSHKPVYFQLKIY